MFSLGWWLVSGTALALVGLGTAFAVTAGEPGPEIKGDFVLRAEIHCADGTVLPSTADCQPGVGQLLHVRVGYPTGGFQDIVGMAPYAPVLEGDCWPTTAPNYERSVCYQWLADGAAQNYRNIGQ